MNAGMVVSLGETPLENSSNGVDAIHERQEFDASIDVLGQDDGAVKVVKVDQIENHDLGSPL